MSISFVFTLLLVGGIGLTAVLVAVALVIVLVHGTRPSEV